MKKKYAFNCMFVIKSRRCVRVVNDRCIDDERDGQGRGSKSIRGISILNLT